MALDTTKTAIMKKIDILKGPESAGRPADSEVISFGNIPVGYELFAHTSETSLVKIKSEGGERKQLNSASRKGIDTLVSPVIRGVDFESLEIKKSVLDAQYNGYVTETGNWYAVPSQSDPERCSIIVLMETTKGKTIVRYGVGTITSNGEGEPSFEDYMAIPLSVTFSDDEDGNNMYLGGTLLNLSAETPEV